MMSTSLNMQAIKCRCSPTRVTQQFHIQHSQWHMHMNAMKDFESLTLDWCWSACLHWRRKTKIQNLTIHFVFYLSPCKYRPTSITLIRSSHHVMCTSVVLANAKFWSFYCKTWYSQYSKWLSPVAFWQLLSALNSFSAGTLPRTSLGELTTLLQTP